MQRGWLIVVVAATLASCGRFAPDYADLSPLEVKTFDPTGQWVRRDGAPLGLIIAHSPRGAWVVESFGKSEHWKHSNACWRVHTGSLNGPELVASSDGSADLKEPVLRTGLLPGTGLFVAFKRKVAVVSGPEANDGECPLAGDYIRKAGPHPSDAFRSQDMPGPIVGDGSAASLKALP